MNIFFFSWAWCLLSLWCDYKVYWIQGESFICVWPVFISSIFLSLWYFIIVTYMYLLFSLTFLYLIILPILKRMYSLTKSFLRWKATMNLWSRTGCSLVSMCCFLLVVLSLRAYWHALWLAISKVLKTFLYFLYYNFIHVSFHFDTMYMLAGVASHGVDYKKSAGGFIHGFRYTG